MEELRRRGLVMTFDNGQKFALTLEGVDRLQHLLARAIAGESESEATSTGSETEFAA